MRKDPGGLAIWDPLAADGAGVTPVDGARSAGGTFAVRAFARERVDLSGKRPALAYLAGTLRSDRARMIRIAVGSDEGIEVRLAGRTVLSRDAPRSGQPDLDLISFDLPAGDTPLVIRAWRTGPGGFRLWVRLSDEQHRRPRGLRVVLPGAGGAQGRLLTRGATLELEREVDLARGTAVIDGWLAFPGGLPVGPDRTVRVTVTGPGAPSASDFSIGANDEDEAFWHVARFEVGGDAQPSALAVDFGGRRLEARVGLRTRNLGDLAAAAADLARAPLDGSLPRTSLESVAWRIDQLRELLEAGDGDRRYLEREIGEARRRAAALARGQDPYADERGGFQRRGYSSAVDGRLHPYVLYVPPAWRESGSGSFGLVVALHGLRGEPMSIMQALFGIPLAEDEDRGRRARHPETPASVPMFAVAPEGFGASNYRTFGERDVLEVVDRVRERYRIDPDRIFITGPSMGGTGSAGVPLRHPGLFAAAAP
ncbi:MAG TPA: prolyl oligopeptidase family serine peptidase, partial [Polyangia bacterium]|nr:prolyl oligopeptidase family serine peptidase [Polyangia bacterium]